MATYYVEYPTTDDNVVLVEVEDKSGGVVRAANKAADPIKSRIPFAQAFSSARSSIKELVAELDAMKIEEAEIKFGLKSVGEAGFFAVGKVGGEMNYEITLKWKKAQSKPGAQNRKKK